LSNNRFVYQLHNGPFRIYNYRFAISRFPARQSATHRKARQGSARLGKASQANARPRKKLIRKPFLQAFELLPISLSICDIRGEESHPLFSPLVQNRNQQTSTKLPQSNTHLNKPSQSFTNLQKKSRNKPCSQTFPAYRRPLRPKALFSDSPEWRRVFPRLNDATVLAKRVFPRAGILFTRRAKPNTI
jgi:hypothetical protein